MIHTSHRSDIFLILDCCHAGKLLLPTRQGPEWSKRIFEFLGAAGPEETTPLPGPDSFSRALIWALKELAKHGEPFISSELFSKILHAPNFPRTGQLPCLGDRGPHSIRRLVLEPLPEIRDEAGPVPRLLREESADSLEYCLNLQFLLPKIPTNNEIRKMCEGLKALISDQPFFARQILWRGLDSKENYSRSVAHRRFRDAVTRIENRYLKSKLKSLSGRDPAAISFPDTTRQDEETRIGLSTPVPSEKLTGKRSHDTLELDSEEEKSPVFSSKRQKMDLTGVGALSVLEQTREKL